MTTLMNRTSPVKLGILMSLLVLFPLQTEFLGNGVTAQDDGQKAAGPDMLEASDGAAANGSSRVLERKEPIQFANRSIDLYSLSNQVRDIEFSYDGKYVAVSYGAPSAPGAIGIWKVAPLERMASFRVLQGAAFLAFSPDGKRIAASGSEGSLTVWKFPSLEEVSTFHVDVSPSRLSFSANGRQIATASDTGQVKLWDMATGKLVREFRGDRFVFATCVGFSPDGAMLAAAGGDGRNTGNALGKNETLGQVNLWTAETGEFIGSLKGHFGCVLDIEFFPDGKSLISTGEDGKSRLWDLTSGEEQVTLNGHQGAVYAAAVQRGGRQLVATASADQTIRLWDAKQGSEVAAIRGDKGPTRAVAIAPGANHAATVGDEHLVVLWDLASHKQIGTLAHGRSTLGEAHPVHCVAWSPDDRLHASAREGQPVMLHNSKTGEVLGILPGHDDTVASVAFSPNGRLLATASYDRSIRLWDVSLKPQASRSIIGTKLNPLRTLNGNTNWVFSVAFSPDSRTVVSSSYDKTVRLWDVATGQEQAVLKGHAAAVRSVVFSPDGKLLASGSTDRTVKIWDARTHQVRSTLAGHTDGIRAVVFSPDGKSIASASDDKTIKLWDVAKGIELRQFTGHRGIVWCLAFSRGGRTLASGSFDKSIRLWDVETGTLRQQLTGHTEVVTSLAFSPNLRLLLSGSYDKTIRLWPAQ